MGAMGKPVRHRVLAGPRSLATAVGCAVTALCLAACDPVPTVKVRNETSSDVEVQFQGDEIGDYHVYERRYVDAGRAARISTGWVAEGRVVIFAKPCAYTYFVSREASNAINSSYGAVTPVELRSDLKLYLSKPGVTVQPKGWPVSFFRKACR